MKIKSPQRTPFLVIVLSLAFAASAGMAFPAQKSRSVYDDTTIIDQVRIKLAADAVVKGGALQVDCKEGIVTLSGYVETEKQKDRAERLARKVKGVKQVINKLTIRVR